MRPMPVQWVTREMIARLRGPASLFRGALDQAAKERRAARWLVLGALCVLAGLVVGLWGMG